MIAFGHTAIGATIGAYSYHIFGSNDLLTGLTVTTVAGVASHYIFDLIPHGHFFRENEYRKKVKYAIVFDLFLSVALFLSVQYLSHGFGISMLYLLFGIGASQFPDVI